MRREVVEPRMPEAGGFVETARQELSVPAGDENEFIFIGVDVRSRSFFISLRRLRLSRLRVKRRKRRAEEQAGERREKNSEAARKSFIHNFYKLSDSIKPDD